ncbi:enoyl-CoA-hydratase DpgD [Micromonospora sp. NPDC048935]|uniref:enoyl-CoA-hydratase DpgD n=1 Tax=Micromonospora sp. NPDC048935 TaxID=3364262 RepID=UPI0037116193
MTHPLGDGGVPAENASWANDIATDDATPRVTFHREGHIGYVTINRPHVLNALDRQTHVELGAVWDEFDADDQLRVAVLSGAGDRAFSVGQDLKELARLDGSGTHAGTSTFGSRGKPGWPRLTERFDLSKPVIAKVRGHAFGGGFELALACDVIVAERSASFALPEVRLGLIAGAGGVFRVTRQAPYRVAMGHLLTGRSMSAIRAYELGLVNEVVDADELDACVNAWASDIARCAPLAVRATKEAATKGQSLSLPEAFTARYEWEERRMRSRDAREGPRAFVEKREPEWEGN